MLDCVHLPRAIKKTCVDFFCLGSVTYFSQYGIDSKMKGERKIYIREEKNIKTPPPHLTTAQPPPTASTVDPCPTIIQISRSPVIRELEFKILGICVIQTQI